MPITVKSTGGGSVTLTAPNTASDLTLTMPSISGTIYATTGGVIPASEGGTGLSSPGASGNILTSNGTTWTSAAPSGGVTSLTAGSGITVSASTGAVTVSQDIYNGTSSNNATYPIGTTINVYDPTSYAINQSVVVSVGSTGSQNLFYGGAGAGRTNLTGTWRSRGVVNGSDSYIFQRTA